MSQKGKSIFAGGIAFVIFAIMRNIIPLSNMEFFVAACAFSIVVTVLSYLVINNIKTNVYPIVEKAWGFCLCFF